MNTYKNQIILTKLSASKLVDKKLCHTVTKKVTALRLFLHFSREEKKLGQILFTIVKLVESSTNFVLAAFYLGTDFRRKSRLKDEHFKFRVLLCASVT